MKRPLGCLKPGGTATPGICAKSWSLCLPTSWVKYCVAALLYATLGSSGKSSLKQEKTFVAPAEEEEL